MLAEQTRYMASQSRSRNHQRLDGVAGMFGSYRAFTTELTKPVVVPEISRPLVSSARSPIAIVTYGRLVDAFTAYRQPGAPTTCFQDTQKPSCYRESASAPLCCPNIAVTSLFVVALSCRHINRYHIMFFFSEQKTLYGP